MPDSRPYAIAKQFRSWAQRITKLNGYNTDAGYNVHLGRSFVDADHDAMPLISILWEGENLTSVDEQHREQVNITVAAFDKLPAAHNDPDALDLMFQDVRRAIKTDLRELDLPYVDTITPTGFAVEQPDADSRIMRANMIYAVTYFESYGD